MDEGSTAGGGRVVLVLTTVHPSDDPRVRHRTVGVLAHAMPVRYAGPPPAPATVDGFEWVALPGNRVLRWVRGLRETLRRDVAVVSLHDPELLPIGFVARVTGRRVVFDVHEDVPAQVRSKEYLPRLLREPLARMLSGLLRVGERWFVITLAERNYAHLFSRPHPVLVNHPLAEQLPLATEGERTSEQPVVYVGDVTTVRGAELAVRAVAGMRNPRPLLLIGRCREPLRSRLVSLAAALRVDLRLEGYQPHPVAMRAVADAAVGISPLLGAPNHRESLPSKVIEYLAVGIPVLASDLPGTRRVVDGLPGAWLLPPGDVKAWTEALDEVTATDAWAAAARSGIAEVRRRFTWPSQAVRELYGQQRAPGPLDHRLTG